MKSIKLAVHFVQSSITVGLLFNRLRQHSTQLARSTHDASKLDANLPATSCKFSPEIFLLWHTPQPFHQRCQIRTVLFTHSLEL